MQNIDKKRKEIIDLVNQFPDEELEAFKQYAAGVLSAVERLEDKKSA